MQLGILEEYNEKKHKDGIDQGTVVQGIEPLSLLKDIELRLFQTGYDATQVLQSIQQDLLVITGQVTVKKKGDDK